MFLAAGILMICRPAQMYRRSWIWSDDPPLKFDLVCCQIMGWIFPLGMTAWSIAFVRPDRKLSRYPGAGSGSV